MLKQQTTCSIAFFYSLPVPNIKVEPKDENPDVSALAQLADKEQIALNSINGFLLILDGDGEITFVSPNIADYLGLAMVSESWVAVLDRAV